MKPLLAAHNLERCSADKKKLFSGLSLQLHAGECLGLSGPSGVGKSLLLRTLALLDPISIGEILWLGEPIQAIPQYRSVVIYLSQKPAFAIGTVKDNLMIPWQFSSHKSQTESATPDWLAWGLPQTFAERKVEQLSGGERQKLALLRALQLQPRVLLLDETTAAMDPESVLLAETSITKWLKGGDRACIWVSHHAEQLQRVATRQLCLTGAGLV
jgi:putative ABC transport system ATP-binding protein